MGAICGNEREIRMEQERVKKNPPRKDKAWLLIFFGRVHYEGRSGNSESEF